MVILSLFLYPLSFETEFKTDIFHSSVASSFGLLGVINKIIYGKPFVLSEHGVYLREQYYFIKQSRVLTKFLKKFLRLLIYRFVILNYNFADKIIPVCLFNKRWEQYLGAKDDKLQVIYNGINDSSEFEFLKQEYVKEKTSFNDIILVGAFYPFKDIETAIRAVAIVKKQVPNIRLYIFGPIKDKDYFSYCLRLIKNLSLKNNVIYRGVVKDLQNYFKVGGVFLSTSVSEGFPYSILEAMLYKQAIVSTSAGGIPELLGDCGLYVEMKNPNSVAKACLKLLHNQSLRIELGWRAHQRAVERFSLSRMLKSYEYLYNSL